jgi:hypothetical protein
MIDPSQFLTGSGALTAKFATHGTTVSGTIASEPQVSQQTAFGTNEPLVWSDGSPRLQLIVELETPEGLQKLYVKSGLKNAVSDAVRAAGQKGLQVGGTLTVTYTGDAAPARAGIAGAKIYAASYSAPAPTAVAVPAGPPIIPAPKMQTPAGPPVAVNPADAALAALV